MRKGARDMAQCLRASGAILKDWIRFPAPTW